MTHCQYHTNRPRDDKTSAAYDSTFQWCLHFAFLFLAVLGLCCLPRLALVVASGGYSSLRCTGSSLQWLLLLWSMGSRVWAQQLWLQGSGVVEHSCPNACVIPAQGWNPCPPHCQVDHHGSPHFDLWDWCLLELEMLLWEPGPLRVSKAGPAAILQGFAI